jgi:hypothetical protein
MDLLSLVLILIVIGVLLTLMNKYLGEFIGQPMLKIINAVVIIAVILFVLSLFFPALPRIHVGR